MAIRETRRQGGRGREARGATTGGERENGGAGPATSADAWLQEGLAWFSIGLGLAETLAPRSLSRLIGVRERPLLLRALGLREMVSGLAILTQRKSAWPLWSRVAGDAMDLALLGSALGSDLTARGRALAATLAVGGVTALDVLGAVRFTRELPSLRTIHVVKTIAVNRTPDDCFAFWRDLENLSTFLRHVESVSEHDERRSRWVARGPAGKTVEWEAEIAREDEGSEIAWRSLEGDVTTEGSVRFEPRPGSRGTLIRVELDYGPPAGAAGAFVAKLFGADPEQTIKEDLHRLKQLLETGEIPTTEGQPSGRREVVHRTLAKLLTGGVS